MPPHLWIPPPEEWRYIILHTENTAWSFHTGSQSQSCPNLHEILTQAQLTLVTRGLALNCRSKNVHEQRNQSGNKYIKRSYPSAEEEKEEKKRVWTFLSRLRHHPSYHALIIPKGQASHPCRENTNGQPLSKKFFFPKKETRFLPNHFIKIV